MGSIRRLVTLAPSVRYGLATLVVLLLATTATYVGQGLLIARVLGRLVRGEDVASTLPLIAGIVGLQLARAAATIGRETLMPAVGGVVVTELRQRLAARLLELGPGWLTTSRTGTVQTTVVDGVTSVEPYVVRLFPQVVASVLGSAAVTAYLATIDVVVALIVGVCALLAPVVTVLSRRWNAGRMDSWLAAYKKLYAETLDAVQGMATLKAFNAARRRRAEMDEEAAVFGRESVSLTAGAVVFMGVVAFLVGIGTSLATGVGSVHLADGRLDVAGLLTILLLAREAFRPLTDLEKAYHSSYAAVPALRGIVELLDTRPAVREPAQPSPAPAARPPAVRFERVGYAYPGRAAPAVDDVTLDVAAGERVALVGSSGAGKSTLVSLLLRFADPDRGRVTIDGVDIRELPISRLRGLIAVVAQDTYLFSRSVADNLRLARPDASDAELVAAARTARAHDFVTDLPDGYATVLGERGLTLSGGQRQRLSLARALLADAPILVLDEATSNVDAANEAEIQVALDRLVEGRTTLVIAHRLSTVRTADRVVVLDAGRVVEHGPPEQLLATSGAYAELAAAQEAGR